MTHNILNTIYYHYHCIIIKICFFGLLAIAYSRSAVAETLSQHPDTLILRRIMVVSLDTDQEAILRQAIPIKVGQPVKPEDFDIMKRNLDASGLPLENMRIGLFPFIEDENNDNEYPETSGESEADGVQLVFDFRPQPHIGQIKLFPLVEIDLNKLNNSVLIHVGDIYDENKINETVASLRDKLHAEGLADAVVTLHQTALTTATVAVGFIIESGAPVTLHKRKITGAGWLNASRIREQLKHMEPLPFDKGSTVTAEVLEKSEFVATAVMRSLGYLEARARIEATALTPKGLDVTYRVERGPRYRIESSQVTGIKYPDPAFWETTTRDSIHKPVTSQRIDDMKQAIEAAAGYQGYMAPKIDLEVTPTPGAHTVAIQAKVDEGTTSSLGSIRINRQAPERGYGKSWYHRHIAPPLTEVIIRKQIRVRPGEDLNRRITDDATSRLMRLNTFEDVKVDTAPTSDTFVRDIIAGVTEKRTAYAGLSLGWNDETGPVSRLTLTEKNIGGKADVLSLGLNLSLDERALGGQISYLDRYWKTGERWLGEEREPSLLWSLFLNESTYDQYTERREGGALRLGYLIGKRLGPWSNGWQARLERITYSPFHDRESYREKFRDYLAATIPYDLTYDRLERGEWDSMRGFLLNTSIEAGVADGLLLDWTTRTDWRRTITHKWVWQVQSEVGLMPTESTDVGISHRFQAGGMNGIRGFEYHGIGPVDHKNDELHIGGATKLILQNEIRYIVNDNVQIPFFFDIGTLDKDPFTIETLRASTGMGVRFKIPGMNQRAYLYYAQNLLKAETDDSRSIHFGFSFDF